VEGVKFGLKLALARKYVLKGVVLDLRPLFER